MFLYQGVLTADFLLEFYQGVKEDFWTGWAAGDVNVYGEELVYTLNDAVDAVHAAGGGASAHSNTPFGFGHLVPDTFDGVGHFVVTPAGDDHDIRLPGREREAFGAEARNVIFRASGGHHFNSSASQTHRLRPQRVTPGPLYEVIQLGYKEALVLKEFV